MRVQENLARRVEAVEVRRRGAEALEAHTVTAADAAFEERGRRALAPGKLADCVVLSRDVLEDAKGAHIAETAVLATVAGGKFVHEKE